MRLTQHVRILACCVAGVLLAGCSGGQGTRADTHKADTQVVLPLQWPGRHTAGSDFVTARTAALTAAHALIGPAEAVQVIFDGMTPVGRVVAALVGRRGTTRFVWLRQSARERGFHVDGAVDGRSILTEPLLGARYTVGPSSFILVITQPTCKEIVLRGAGVPDRTVQGFAGVFQLSSTTSYTDAQPVLPGHALPSVRLTIVAGS